MTITRTITVAAGVFAPGHLGELTWQVPFELVDGVLEETRAREQRLRDLPSRAGAAIPVTEGAAGPAPAYRYRAGKGFVRGAGRPGGPAARAGRAVRPVPDGGLRRLRLDQGAGHEAEPGLAGEAEGRARGDRLPGDRADDPGRDRYPGSDRRGVRPAGSRRDRLRPPVAAPAGTGHAGADRPRLRRRRLPGGGRRHEGTVPGPADLHPPAAGDGPAR